MTKTYDVSRRHKVPCFIQEIVKMNAGFLAGTGWDYCLTKTNNANTQCEKKV